MFLTSKRVIDSTFGKYHNLDITLSNNMAEENVSSGPLENLLRASGQSHSLKKDINKSEAMMQSQKLSPRLRDLSLAEGAMII